MADGVGNDWCSHWCRHHPATRGDGVMAVSKNPSTRVTLFEVASGSGGLRMIPVFQLHLCGVHVLQPQFRRASSWCCWGGGPALEGGRFPGAPITPDDIPLCSGSSSSAWSLSHPSWSIGPLGSKPHPDCVLHLCPGVLH